nr:hypothetical protein [Paraburkholderia phenoliruptrix]
MEWARRSSRGERPRLGLLVLLKVFQQMHHFPSLDSIPVARRRTRARGGKHRSRSTLRL